MRWWIIASLLFMGTFPTRLSAEDESYEDEEEESEQPPVTAGGMFRKENYPISLLERPLTLNKGLWEVRGSIGIDLSSGNVFKNWTGRVEAQYGISDALELHTAISQLLAGKSNLETLFELGIEAAILYDFVDVRFLLELPTSPCCDMNAVLGFPFRYKPQPQVAIIALDRLVTFHSNGDTPDLTIGVGGIFQALPALAVIARGELILVGFDTDQLIIPISGGVQFTPKRSVDVGVTFTLGDIKNEEDPIAQRSLMFFFQTRM